MYCFELTILNIFLSTLLHEKVKKIKTTIYSSKVTPFTYYLSHLLGDIIFNICLYFVFYWALYFGAKKLISQYAMLNEFQGCFFILLNWKLRYVFIGYLISHFINGYVDKILKYYLFIYSIVNGGFLILNTFYPKLPLKYIFDCGDIWQYTFNSDYTLKYWEQIIALFVNFILALLISTIVDNYYLNRNFLNQKKHSQEYDQIKRITFDENMSKFLYIFFYYQPKVNY